MLLSSSRIAFSLSLSLLTGIELYTQSLKGSITDNKNIPVPFAVVYDETSSTGTTSNAEGYYELKLESGNHTVVFKAMGYHQEKSEIAIAGKTVVHNVKLKEQPVELKEVVITPGKEDPAYAIMRKVISLAPYHLNQVKQYTADVYLRGTAHIIKIPKFIAKRTMVDGESNAIKSGDVYMEESVNQISFTAPDTYEQKVLSIRSTFPGNSDDINPMGLINSSLYEADIEDFISPLAPNAFQFYQYKYEGFFDESERTIFKIKVTPKRNSQQLMKGYIFIVDQLWCLHSADVSINMFFGDMNYKIIYSPVRKNAWLPVSYQFYVDAAIMGIKANFKYASSIKFKEVHLNDKIVAVRDKPTPVPSVDDEESSKTEGKRLKSRQEMEKLLSKEEMTNRDMVKLSMLMAKESSGDTVVDKSLEIKDPQNNRKVVVEKDAVQKDTTYWNTIRPIPLTAIESKLPEMHTGRISGEAKDSITISVGRKDKENKVINKITGFITNGSSFRMFDSTLNIKYNGIAGLKKFDFNTVDGFIFRQTFSLEQSIDSVHTLKIMPGAAYAFSRERFMWWADISYDYAPLRLGSLQLHAGSESADYNSESGIISTVNSISTLFFRRNYLKLYHQNHIFINNRIDIANGLNLSVRLGYRTAQPLQNHSDYSFFYRDERDFSPNIPYGPAHMQEGNLSNEEAYWKIGVEFTPRHYYRISGGQKHYEHSKFPTLFVSNTMAVPDIINSTADFDMLEIGMRQHHEWGMMHSFNWNVKGGFFLSRNQLYTMDYKFFNNQDLPVLFGNTSEVFRLMPFYRNAATESFVEAHVKFTAPYLLLKYLPLISNKLWVESLHLNYLTIGRGRHYWEAGYSLGRIFMTGSIGVFAGFTEQGFQNMGLQISIDY